MKWEEWSHIAPSMPLLLALALLPFVFVLMTSFTRISIVLTFLRQALATTVPSTHLIIGLSLILTAYVMHPVFRDIHEQALAPYFKGDFAKEKDHSEVALLIEKSWPPLQEFMLSHTRQKDLLLFADLGKIDTSTTLSWYTIIPAFVLSELRTAFLMGFLLFLPFLVIDLVVTSLLMSLGMIMLPPVMISFPFKLLLFVIVDGWHLVVQQVVLGYR